MPRLKLTVVAPVFNEEEVIAHFHARLSAVLDAQSDIDASILFVVDRSTDNTLQVLRDIVTRDPRSKVLALSSRFGHQMSLLAGIEHARDADAIIMMDSDLQHPPELIPELVAHFQRGFEVVYTVRRDVESVSMSRKMLGNLFYLLLSKLSRVKIHANAADFRLISGRVAHILCDDFQERNMFLRGLFSWIGFSQTGIEYDAAKRFAGQPKYSLSRMVQLALTGILSFSTKPLHIAMFAGAGFAGIGFIFMVVNIFYYFFDRSIPSGWTTMVTLLLMFNGVQLIVLGIMGAYIGGIYDEVKRRPRYIIAEEISHHG